MHPFRNFLAVLPPPPYTKLKLVKKVWIHESNVVWGLRGGVGPMRIGKHPRNASVPRLLTMIVDVNMYSPRIARENESHVMKVCGLTSNSLTNCPTFC